MASASKASKEGGDDLLPGIPNHLTMHHIAPKLEWETSKVLETMNSGWLSRTVYDEKVRSHSTDPFLVLLSGRRSVDGDGMFVSALYSCKDGSVRHLPPIPTEDRFVFQKCVCLDGKIYLWVLIDDDSCEDSEPVDDDSSEGSETEDDDSSDGWAKVCLWEFDLAGDSKWQQRRPQSFSTFHPWIEDLGTGYGVLDGKIYKFRGSSHRDRGVLGGAIAFDRDENQKPDLMPEAKVYDPQSDVWSRITPEGSDDSSGSWSDDIAPILEWARDEFGADHSKAFSADGWYEPYFSEWRKKYSSAPQSAVDVLSHNENQVYYTNRIYYGYDEFLFFFGGKLAKFTRNTMELEDDGEWNDAVSNIELYDTQKNTWKQLISLKVNFHPPFEEDSNFSIVDFASIEGVIWAVFMVSRHGQEDGKVKYHLLRSPVLLDENSDSSVSWIYTGRCLADGVARCMVRPIYI